ncbi:MAG: AzlC family ABC transporter permease [Actinomycetes bacterium]
MSATPDLEWAKERRRILVDAASIGLAVGTYGLSFGALAVTAGLTMGQAIALSTLTFTGASQFAFVGVVAAGGSVVAAVLAALFLGIRNSLYGLSLAPLLCLPASRRWLAAQLVLDESTAMTISQPSPRSARWGFWSTGTAVFVCWNIATVLGAVGANAVGDPQNFGLDAAVGAAFLALLWPRLTRLDARLTALLGAALALALTPVLPPGVPVLVAAAAAFVVAWPTPASERPDRSPVGGA